MDVAANVVEKNINNNSYAGDCASSASSYGGDYAVQVINGVLVIQELDELVINLEAEYF